MHERNTSTLSVHRCGAHLDGHVIINGKGVKVIAAQATARLATGDIEITGDGVAAVDGDEDAAARASAVLALREVGQRLAGRRDELNLRIAEVEARIGTLE